jgi:hypothetical protein
MLNSIVITVPHALGAEEAKKRITERMQLLRQDYISKIAASEVSWNGNAADLRVVFLGQAVSGKIFVMADLVRIEVQLPWLLSALGGKLQSILQNNASEALRIGPPKA